MESRVVDCTICCLVCLVPEAACAKPLSKAVCYHPTHPTHFGARSQTGTKRYRTNLAVAMDYQPISKYRHVYCPGLKRIGKRIGVMGSGGDISRIPSRHHDGRSKLHQGQLEILRVPRRRRWWSHLHSKASQSWKNAFPAPRARGP